MPVATSVSVKMQRELTKWIDTPGRFDRMVVTQGAARSCAPVTARSAAGALARSSANASTGRVRQPAASASTAMIPRSMRIFPL